LKYEDNSNTHQHSFNRQSNKTFTPQKIKSNDNLNQLDYYTAQKHIKQQQNANSANPKKVYKQDTHKNCPNLLL